MRSLNWGFLVLLLCNQALSLNVDLSDISAKFLDYAKRPDVFDWMVSIRRKIHEYPELLYEEFETTKLIRGELDKLGIPYKYPFAVTGIIGFIGTGRSPYVAIRADMDALPIQEMVEWEHKSKVPGKMHACGHDAHVAMLLGAAKILQDHRHELKGTVVLVFQPAEEGGAGAEKMLEEGALKDVEAIFGLHVAPELPVSSVTAKAGALLAGSGQFKAVITGKGGHGALPQYAIDPIVAASTVVMSLQQLVSREADPLEPQVVTVGIFQGGDAFNVIPDSVTIGGTFRALSKETLLKMKARIGEVITGQAAVQRCEAVIDFLEETHPFYPPTINHEDLHDFFVNVAGDLLGINKVFEPPHPAMGSEDFAFYQERLPGYFSFVGMQNETQKQLKALHSPYFEVNEDCFPYGAALHASLATRFLLETPLAVPLPEPKHHDEL